MIGMWQETQERLTQGSEAKKRDRGQTKGPEVRPGGVVNVLEWEIRGTRSLELQYYLDSHFSSVKLLVSPSSLLCI